MFDMCNAFWFMCITMILKLCNFIITISQELNHWNKVKHVVVFSQMITKRYDRLYCRLLCKFYDHGDNSLSIVKAIYGAKKWGFHTLCSPTTSNNTIVFQNVNILDGLPKNHCPLSINTWRLNICHTTYTYMRLTSCQKQYKLSRNPNNK